MSCSRRATTHAQESVAVARASSARDYCRDVTTSRRAAESPLVGWAPSSSARCFAYMTSIVVPRWAQCVNSRFVASTVEQSGRSPSKQSTQTVAHTTSRPSCRPCGPPPLRPSQPSLRRSSGPSRPASAHLVDREEAGPAQRSPGSARSCWRWLSDGLRVWLSQHRPGPAGWRPSTGATLFGPH